MKKSTYTLSVLLAFFSWKTSFSQKLESISNGKAGNFENLYRINDSIYRGEQPNKEGALSLQKLGIKSVLNLRSFATDGSELKETELRSYHERINTWVLSETDVIDALRLLMQSEKPVMIHCKHGSDRTGTIVAAYRIVFEGWSKERAIEEMLRENYGFHPCFQNLIFLLEHLDLDRIKQELQLI